MEPSSILAEIIVMSYRIENFQNDPSWILSIGEKLDKVHFRQGHLHAECDSQTGFCTIHYDEHDPHESLSSLINHLLDSNSGKLLIGIAVAGIIDQVLIGGSIRKSLMK